LQAANLTAKMGHVFRPLVTLLCLLPPALAQHTTGTLRPEQLTDPRVVPLAIEHLVQGQLPAALAPAGHKVKLERAALRVDSDGDGELDRQVSAHSPQVVRVVAGEHRTRQLLVYYKGGAWYAAPAAMLKGTVGGHAVELLDTDMDGRFDGEADYLRWDKGSFYRQNSTRLAPIKKGLVQYALKKERDAWILALTPVKRPAGFDDAQCRALTHLNLWRGLVGLAPLGLSTSLSDGCQKHADYLHRNGNDGADSGNEMGVHGEDPDKPGYTKEGLDAARNSNIVKVSDPVKAIDLQTPTIMHRVLFLRRHDTGLGVGISGHPGSKLTKGYTVIRTGHGLVNRVRDIVVVPAPGQRRVPILAMPEHPVPENDPGCYLRKPGYPVSVTFGILPLKSVSLKLFRGRDGKIPVSGFLFTPERPLHSTLANNNLSAFFLPKYPLRKGSTYLAVFEATLEHKDKAKNKSVRLVWSFKT